jgi:hypothetical protein
MKDRCERYNEGKNRMGLIPPTILWALGEVYTQGAEKYEADNWAAGCPYRELMDCALRHMVKWLAGHRDDAESGNHHLAHALWNIGTLLHMEMLPDTYSHFDDRLKMCASGVPNSSGEKEDEVAELQKQIKKLDSWITELVFAEPKIREQRIQLLRDAASAMEVRNIPKDEMRGLMPVLTTSIAEQIELDAASRSAGPGPGRPFKTTAALHEYRAHLPEVRRQEFDHARAGIEDIIRKERKKDVVETTKDSTES